MSSQTKSYTMSAVDLSNIIDARPAIMHAISHAMSLHGDAIMREIALFDNARRSNPARWAKLCMVKALMSPGAKLPANIAASHVLYSHVVTCSLNSFEQVKDLLTGTSYGCIAYGHNVKALLDKQSAIAATTPYDMTWNGIAQVFKGFKTRSWALALYNAYNEVFTLDRHMLRGLLALANIVPTEEEVSICKSRYLTLAGFMLDLCEEMYPMYPPLCIQWALWNEFRHPGKHASHADLAR